jgi:hypothetical protein
MSKSRQRGLGLGSSASSAVSTASATASAALSAVTARSLVMPAAICTIPPRMRRPPRTTLRTASLSWGCRGSGSVTAPPMARSCHDLVGAAARMLRATIRGGVAMHRHRSAPAGLVAFILVVGLGLSGAASAATKTRDYRSGRPTTSIPMSAANLTSDPRTSVRPEPRTASDGLSEALRLGEISEATYALNRALALFHADVVGRRLDSWPSPILVRQLLSCGIS